MGLHNYKKTEEYYIEAEIIEMNSNFAVLCTDRNEKITWPSTQLPSGIQIGEKLKLKLLTKKLENEENFDQMRGLLNEIIG